MAQAMFSREEWFKRVVDSSILGILVADFQRRILEANDAFLRMGYSRDDFQAGKINWIEWIPLNRAQASRAEQLLRTEKAELVKLNSIMTGREECPLQLKAEINALLEELGRPKRYQI